MVETREFTELLKGVRPIKDADGNIVVQSIMNMQIVGLTTDDEYSLDNRFANPLQSVQGSNRSYGEITLRNTTPKETITPAQIAIMTKQSAQNHGMVKAGYVSAGSTTTFNDAGCVQGSQTGHFRGTQEFRMIPVTMREMLFEKVGQTSGHGNIYPAIEKLGRDTGARTGNYLDVYFSKYDKKLEQFIAHFERPEKLIGVIVLIDGEIVAVDKYPSFTYAEQVWDILIRDCYGALAIISDMNERKGKKLFSETLRKTRQKTGESTLEKLERALNKTKKVITKTVEEKIQDLLDLTLEAQKDTVGNPTGGNAPKSYILKHDGYIGQAVSESDYHHLVSIVKKERFDPTALRTVNEMRRKARSQDRFTL
jgi:hypothetical protein